MSARLEADSIELSVAAAQLSSFSNPADVPKGLVPRLVPIFGEFEQKITALQTKLAGQEECLNELRSLNERITKLEQNWLSAQENVKGLFENMSALIFGTPKSDAPQVREESSSSEKSKSKRASVTESLLPRARSKAIPAKPLSSRRVSKSSKPKEDSNLTKLRKIFTEANDPKKGFTNSALSGPTQLDSKQILALCQKLRKQGLIQCIGERSSSRWHLVHKQ